MSIYINCRLSKGGKLYYTLSFEKDEAVLFWTYLRTDNIISLVGIPGLSKALLLKPGEKYCIGGVE